MAGVGISGSGDRKESRGLHHNESTVKIREAAQACTLLHGWSFYDKSHITGWLACNCIKYYKNGVQIPYFASTHSSGNEWYVYSEENQIDICIGTSWKESTNRLSTS